MEYTIRMTSEDKIMDKVFGDRKYLGKHVVVAGDKIFTARSANEVNKLMDRVQKKYPKTTLSVAHVLKEGIWSL